MEDKSSDDAIGFFKDERRTDDDFSSLISDNGPNFDNSNSDYNQLFKSHIHCLRNVGSCLDIGWCCIQEMISISCFKLGLISMAGKTGISEVVLLLQLANHGILRILAIARVVLACSFS